MKSISDRPTAIAAIGTVALFTVSSLSIASTEENNPHSKIVYAQSAPLERDVIMEELLEVEPACTAKFS